MNDSTIERSSGDSLPETEALARAPSARTLWIDGQGRLTTIDQTLLPFAYRTFVLDDEAACADAIRTMRVRGAPLIGAVGAYGLALALREAADDAALARAQARLLATRPTAVNLRWGLARVADRVRPLPVAARARAAWDEAARLCDDDVECNRRIGAHAIAWLAGPLARAREQGRPLRILTHCNAGPIATLAWGTALSAVFQLAAQRQPVHVWVDETRPRNQGASLTCWELARAGIAHTLVADNAGGLLMMRGQVDAVIVGCDRVAANGDVANKVGTYLKALAARAHSVPFAVACPSSTIDPSTPSGLDIEIEYRSPREVTHVRGCDEHGRVVDLRIAPEGCDASNPAFDVTPAALVDALLTEFGACRASAESIAALLARGKSASPAQQE
ncbi:MAG: S-methyl-5-thioribose-1-phosphate isomerase [Burkholderiaceae bacterium]